MAYKSQSLDFFVAGLMLLGLFSCFGLTGSSPERPTPKEVIETDRELAIDRFVDSKIEQEWRPMLGGNSKEDAASVTKDYMKAKTWDELERAIEFHTGEGR